MGDSGCPPVSVAGLRQESRPESENLFFLVLGIDAQLEPARLEAAEAETKKPHLWGTTKGGVSAFSQGGGVFFFLAVSVALPY